MKVVKYLKDIGRLGDTTIMLSTDHSSETGYNNHGVGDPISSEYNNFSNMHLNIPFFVKGPGIKKSHKLKQKIIIKEIPYIISKIAGVAPRKEWPVVEDIDEFFINDHEYEIYKK